VQKSVHSAHASNDRAAGTTGTPCAMGLRLIARSPRSAGLDSLRRLRARHPRLDASIGAPGPHAFAVRNRRARLTRRSGHRIPHPTSVTIAIRPSCGCGTGRRIGVICVSGKANYFGREGLADFRKWARFARRASQPHAVQPERRIAGFLDRGREGDGQAIIGDVICHRGSLPFGKEELWPLTVNGSRGARWQKHSPLVCANQIYGKERWRTGSTARSDCEPCTE